MQTTSATSTDLSTHSIKLAIQSGQFQRASELAQQAVEKDSRDVESWYCLAVCQRKLEQFTQALASLDILLSIAPDYERGFQEKGYNLLALERKGDAIDAFDRAVSINPTLLASWKILAGEPNYRRQEEAKHHSAWLANLPRELVAVASFTHQKKLHKAEQLCRGFLKRNPRNIEAMRMLAELGCEFQILDDAEYLLESCLTFSPDFVRARFDYVNVLHRRQKFHQALEQALILYNADKNNVSFIVGLANAQQASGWFEKAIQTYDEALLKEKDAHTVLVSKGHALKTIGQVEHAINAYQQAYKVKCDHGDAYWSLANLKTYRFDERELELMHNAETNDGTTSDDKTHLCFALGKAYEDRKDYSRSFTFYEKGNALKKANGRYELDRVAYELDFQAEHFNADFFEKFKGNGCDSSAPIFIVGLPRAGSTLLEQILASHSQVDGTMELANVISMAHHLNGRLATHDTPRYPGVLETFSSDQCLSLGERYIKETAVHRQGAPYFIDKMPNNFRHIPFIHLILPNAKIIDARREPMACCFSGYKQLFAEGQDFSYGLEEVGDYYRRYVDIMQHWDEVLPGRILRIQHEDLHDDLERQVRRILDYCDLPFEQGCVDFHKTERPVRTPSSEQVRQPIYSSAINQWEHYDEFLTPLKRVLGDLLVTPREAH